MRISRRSLRKGLVLAGCLWGQMSVPAVWIGIALIAVGAGLHWLSKAYLEQNRHLTTAGPYRFTRNPFYLANFVIDAGIVCVIGSAWIALVYFIAWALAYDATIRDEEARLRKLFGRAFDDYAAAVPRFWPLRRPLDPALARGRFDWKNPSLMHGREYARLLGIALAPGVIWAASLLRTLRIEILDERHGFELGLVLFLPALWVLKLALAETFRRPETGLLLAVVGRDGRTFASLVALMPLIVSVIVYGTVAGCVAVGVLVGTAVVWGSLGISGRSRLVGDLVLMLGALTSGAVAGVLWLAVVPALWFGASVLDEVGRMRFGLDLDSSARREWRYFPRIAAGAMLAMAVVGSAKVWAH